MAKRKEKPWAPYKPLEPEKILKEQRVYAKGYIEEGSPLKSLQDAATNLKCGLEDLQLEIEEHSCCCGDFTSTLRLFKLEDVPNPYYNADLKTYTKQLALYEKEKAKYEKELTAYNEQKEARQSKDRKSQIRRLTKELDKLRKEEGKV